MLQVTINVCVAPPLSPVEVDHTVRDSGWQRVSWPLRDFKGLIENTPAACRLSSPIFYLNGDWYLDLYPAGYRLDEDDREARVSVYLHSTKSQADRGDKLKKRLKFGIKRINPLPRDLYAALGEDVEDANIVAARPGAEQQSPWEPQPKGARPASRGATRTAVSTCCVAIAANAGAGAAQAGMEQIHPPL